ncbi:Acyl-coenzyme A thioesterase 9, mitochondrial [Nymphon striatum]|nr:Acyl-coenzyme A thioesterase 9, mitochondrial [Nymphon striatum]
MASVVGAQKHYCPKPMDRSHLFSSLPKSQEELPPRKMKDSYDECFIPLSNNINLREKYVNHRGGVRFGRILEDLDLFAVWLCYKHCVIPGQKEGDQSPLTIVTALVDQINLFGKHLRTDCDIKLCGNVTWVGKSSLQSSMTVLQMIEGKWEHQMDACFVLVARDPNNAQAGFVNPLEAETKSEKLMLQQGEENKKRRQLVSSQSLLKQPPNLSESQLIHNQFLQTVDSKAETFKARIKPAGSVCMEDAKLKNVLICHPQERNRTNKVFGGFIMRQAFELAWANGYVYRNIHNKVFGGFLMVQAYELAYATSLVFSKSRPFITYVDDILFRKPVEIGSLLYLLSQVAYTDGDNMQIRVHAYVKNPELGTQDTTNVFHFTFKTVDKKAVPEVIPMAYHVFDFAEAMLYLDGKRHLEEALSNGSHAPSSS